MHIDSLCMFVETVRSGSFTSVAANRQISVSSVSRTIATIEKNLGIRLFQRSTRKLALTEAGSVYYEQIYLALEHIEQAKIQAKSGSEEPGGKVRITASPSFGVSYLAPRLSRFARQFPNLSVELTLTDENLNLIESRIDVAIRQGPLIDSNLIATTFLVTHYRVCASKQYLKEHGQPSTPEDLVHHQCVVFPLPKFSSTWKFKNKNTSTSNKRLSSEETEVSINSVLKINNGLAMKRCAVDGAGIVLLSNWLIDDELKSGELVDVFPDYLVTATEYETKVSFVYPARSYIPSNVRAVVDFLKSSK